MQTASSASRTCIRTRSALEYTATVRMPISRQARNIRRAISPRLAMTTFSSMTYPRSDDGEQWLVVFHRFAVFHQDRLDGAGLVGLDLVHHFHRFDNAQHIPGLVLLAHFDVRDRARRSPALESTNPRGS